MHAIYCIHAALINTVLFYWSGNNRRRAVVSEEPKSSYLRLSSSVSWAGSCTCIHVCIVSRAFQGVNLARLPYDGYGFVYI